MKELLAIKNKWLEESRKGCVDAFECALKEAYQLGLEDQCDIDADLCKNIEANACDTGFASNFDCEKAIRNNKESK